MDERNVTRPRDKTSTAAAPAAEGNIAHIVVLRIVTTYQPVGCLANVHV